MEEGKSGLRLTLFQTISLHSLIFNISSIVLLAEDDGRRKYLEGSSSQEQSMSQTGLRFLE
jgi:hypothetical protein